jgi:hypothetical protein
MDPAQPSIFDVGWVFFAGWGIVLAAVSLIAFGRELVSPAEFTRTDRAEADHTVKPSFRDRG